jgi:hypothetical protein
MSERRPTPDRWVRLSARYFLDERILRAGWESELLWLRALAWSRFVRSDGHVSAEHLPYLTIGLTSAGEELAERLVDVELWERCDDGWRVPPARWERWQQTEQEIDAARDASRVTARDRQRRHRAKLRGESDDETF